MEVYKHILIFAKIKYTHNKVKYTHKVKYIKSIFNAILGKGIFNAMLKYGPLILHIFS